MELVKGVSESLGFEASYMNQELNFDSSFQLLAINYYPSRMEFDGSRGLMPHTDHGLLTLFYKSGIPGLEVPRNEKWVGMSDVPNTFAVLNSDHMEVVENNTLIIT
ncbi:hypothetical protein L2E82_03606 [Cichorium intybus]|uniref:Uncharacterized protein n=1 Tax=Cichorium intybus TaxID=13427 RepID=A0ACB9H509_CICIN|nr:hypothetical protein L2E82_03606 [Cichorium intybus]